MSGGDADSENGGKGRASSPVLGDDHGMPVELIYWGIAIGLLLIASGISIMAFVAHASQVMTAGGLTTCIGFGIVLAAFGTRVAGTWRSWSIVGSGAMAVVLFLLLEFYAPRPPPVAPFVYGYLRGTDTMQDVEISGQTNFLVGRLGPQTRWEFFAREEWLTGDVFSITASPPAGVLPHRIYIGCLNLSLLRDNIGNPNGVDLSLLKDPADPAGQQWLLVRTGQSDALGVFGNPECPVKGRESFKISSVIRESGDLLIGPSVAAEIAPDIKPIFDALSADSLELQGQAQDTVAQLRDPSAIEALVQKWQPVTWNDRLDTALVVAWVSGIRKDRAVAVPIASAFSSKQLDHIVELTGSNDRTTRYNAAELLSWILQSTAWPHPPAQVQIEAIVDAALRPFIGAEFSSELNGDSGMQNGNILYNTLVALQDAKCDMRPVDLTHVTAVLVAFERSKYAQKANVARTVTLSQHFRAKHCTI